MNGVWFYIISKLYKYRVKDAIFPTKKRKICLMALTQKKVKYLIMDYFVYHILGVCLSYIKTNISNYTNQC